MKRIFTHKLLFIFITPFILAGCASTHSNSNNISVVKGPISANCRFLGDVSVESEASSPNMTSQHAQLTEALRNKASQLGANTLIISSKNMSDKKHWHSKLRHETGATHTFTGNAYYCPN